MSKNNVIKLNSFRYRGDLASTQYKNSKSTSIRDSVKFKLRCPVDFSWISVMMKLLSKALISNFLIMAI